MAHIRGTIGISRELERYLYRLEKKNRINETIFKSLGFENIQKEKISSLNSIEKSVAHLSINVEKKSAIIRKTFNKYALGNLKSVDHSYLDFIKNN